MNYVYFSMGHLFNQLGLPSDPDDIDRFIAQHRALSDGVAIEHAPFWNQIQADFLKRAIDTDSEWVEAVEQLDARLRY